MAGKLEFKEKLHGVLTLAQEQGDKITLEQAEQYFEEDNLSQEQVELVCDYLMSQNVVVKGYVKTCGVIKDAEEKPRDLSSEEQDYLTEYLQELHGVKGETLADARLAYYLPMVADEALSIERGELFLGDVIQEGNVSLMLALKEAGAGKEQEEEIMDSVRSGMRAFVSSQTEAKLQDRKVVGRVAELDEAIKQMSEELGRKVAVDEVAEYTAMSEDEIVEIMKLAGEELSEEPQDAE